MPETSTETENRIAKMVEQQIRTWDVFEDRILDIYHRIPREWFVPADKRDLAYFDFDLPLEGGQRMLPPKVEGRFLAELSPRNGELALHVGTGSGYFAALLAQLTDEVHSVEIDGALAERAAENLAAAGISNVTVHNADGARGFSQEGPYDIIVLTGSTPILAEEFANQLKPKGRLLAPVGTAPVMSIRLLENIGGSNMAKSDLFEYYIDPLENAPKPPGFSF